MIKTAGQILQRRLPDREQREIASGVSETEA
jgi:hypothetical protein